MSDLVLHKEILKQHFERKSIKYLMKIINLGVKNGLVGRNGLKENKLEYLFTGVNIIIDKYCLYNERWLNFVSIYKTFQRIFSRLFMQRSACVTLEFSLPYPLGRWKFARLRQAGQAVTVDNLSYLKSPQTPPPPASPLPSPFSAPSWISRKDQDILIEIPRSHVRSIRLIRNTHTYTISNS